MREKGNTTQSIYISHKNVLKPWFDAVALFETSINGTAAQLAWSDKATGEWGIKLAPSEGPSPLITEEIKPPRTKQFFPYYSFVGKLSPTFGSHTRILSWYLTVLGNKLGPLI
jgi:hypothetical protein